ncbi:hypothetical protein DL239_11800 [Sedimentitalea sp. CY04]|uniref:Uncharacterized protein n=2 Tax=Parasedimentitalea denitrificans TaxID=2211118 RepID=A0ABX0W7S5_9RHOB|nr:hypothetical protein [Sedimentitalea sp. CY04]
MLFSASAEMGLGVTVFQTALPAATRIWTPTHVALGSSVYLNDMMIGELSGAGLTLPVEPHWQRAIGDLLWSFGLSHYC